MPAFTSPKTWINGETITHTALNLLGSAVETFLNVTKLNSTNIQAGGISLSNLAKPNSVHAVTLTCAEGGTGTARALADFQGYTEILDQIALNGTGTIIGMSVSGATQMCDAAQKVQLYLKLPGGAETAIASSELACIAAGSTTPASATLNQVYTAGNILRVKMTGAASLANVPVIVTVWLKENHRS